MVERKILIPLLLVIVIAASVSGYGLIRFLYMQEGQVTSTHSVSTTTLTTTQIVTSFSSVTSVETTTATATATITSSSVSTTTTTQTKISPTTITKTVTRTTTVTVTTTATMITPTSGLDSSCWSTYQHDFQRTGYSIGYAPQSNATLWVNHDLYAQFASPISADGRVFIYSGGYTFAINASTGSTLWKVSGSLGVQPQLTYFNGSILHGTRSTGLSIIDVETGARSSLHASRVLSVGGGAPIVDDRGVVYFGETHLQKPSPDYPASTFFAYNLSNRSRLWEFPLAADEQGISSAAASVDGWIIIFSAQHGLHALDAASGQQLWMFNTSAGRLGGPSISAGRVFAVGTDGYIYALKQRDGGIVWRTQLASSIGYASSPAVGGGRVFASDGHSLHALDAEDGSVLWSFDLGGMQSSPTASGGLVFAVSTNATLYALREGDGSIAWSLKLSAKSRGNMISVAVCDGPYSPDQTKEYGPSERRPLSLHLSGDYEDCYAVDDGSLTFSSCRDVEGWNIPARSCLVFS